MVLVEVATSFAPLAGTEDWSEAASGDAPPPLSSPQDMTARGDRRSKSLDMNFIFYLITNRDTKIKKRDER